MSTKITKSKSKFTFVDIILIVAIVVVAALVVYNVFIEDATKSDKEKHEIEYQILVEKVSCSKFSLKTAEDGKLDRNFLDVGEKVYLVENSAVVGEIVSVSATPYLESTGQVDAEGDLIYGTYPDYVNLIITVKTTAIQGNNGYDVSGYDLVAGSEIEFRTATYIGKGIVSRVDIKEEDKS